MHLTILMNSWNWFQLFSSSFGVEFNKNLKNFPKTKKEENLLSWNRENFNQPNYNFQSLPIFQFPLRMSTFNSIRFVTQELFFQHAIANVVRTIIMEKKWKIIIKFESSIFFCCFTEGNCDLISLRKLLWIAHCCETHDIYESDECLWLLNFYLVTFSRIFYFIFDFDACFPHFQSKIRLFHRHRGLTRFIANNFYRQLHDFPLF